MKNVYRVSYKTKYSGVRDWMSDTKDVLANDDAQAAVDMCKRVALKDSHRIGRRNAL